MHERIQFNRDLTWACKTASANIPVSCHAFSIRALSPRTAAANAASRPCPAAIKLLTKPWTSTLVLVVIPTDLWQFTDNNVLHFQQVRSWIYRSVCFGPCSCVYMEFCVWQCVFQHCHLGGKGTIQHQNRKGNIRPQYTLAHELCFMLYYPSKLY